MNKNKKTAMSTGSGGGGKNGPSEAGCSGGSTASSGSSLKTFCRGMDSIPDFQKVTQLSRDLENQKIVAKTVEHTLTDTIKLHKNLETENIRLRKKNLEFGRIAEKERSRAEEAWRQLEMTKVYNKVGEVATEQNRLIEMKFRQAVESEREKCDKKLRDMEKEIKKIKKEKELLGRKVEHLEQAQSQPANKKRKRDEENNESGDFGLMSGRVVGCLGEVLQRGFCGRVGKEEVERMLVGIVEVCSGARTRDALKTLRVKVKESVDAWESCEVRDEAMKLAFRGGETFGTNQIGNGNKKSYKGKLSESLSRASTKTTEIDLNNSGADFTEEEDHGDFEEEDHLDRGHGHTGEVEVTKEKDSEDEDALSTDEEESEWEDV